MMRLTIIIALLAACGHRAPRPRELDTLDNLRRTPDADAAAKRSPELVREADHLEGRSHQAWKDNELEDSRLDALLGWIKLNTAIAVWQQDQAKRRIDAADADKAKTDKEYARVAKDLSTLQEEIALLEKLGKAKSTAEVERIKAEQEKQKLAGELAQQQQRGDTQTKISNAELALKTADTVEARTYAKDAYQAAVDLIERARTELKDGNYAAAGTSADQAKQKAEAATATAKPEYMKATEAKDRKARDEALGKDAAALAGITVRLDKKGDVTRLVLTYSNAFKAHATQITTGKESVLDGVAELLKKYPSYPVQIIGHTDTKGKADALLVVSQARAQAVYDALVSRGVDAKRFVVSGVGGEQPIGDNRNQKGRDANNRVEMVFLYQ